jgi:hypothetical protein
METRGAIGSHAMTDYSTDEFLRSLDEEAEYEDAPPKEIGAVSPTALITSGASWSLSGLPICSRGSTAAR